MWAAAAAGERSGAWERKRAALGYEELGSGALVLEKVEGID